MHSAHAQSCPAAIKPRTRRAIAAACRAAQQAGENWPTLRMAVDAAEQHRANLGAVAAALGYLKTHDGDFSRDTPGWFHDARCIWHDDSRVAVLTTAEQVILFVEFLQITNIEPQFLILLKRDAAKRFSLPNDSPRCSEARCRLSTIGPKASSGVTARVSAS